MNLINYIKQLRKKSTEDQVTPDFLADMFEAIKNSALDFTGDTENVWAIKPNGEIIYAKFVTSVLTDNSDGTIALKPKNLDVSTIKKIYGINSLNNFIVQNSFVTDDKKKIGFNMYQGPSDTFGTQELDAILFYTKL